jgi:hypothetical protein
MSTYYDNVLNEEYTPLRFPSFKNWDGVQKVMATMPDDQGLGEWELHTLEDMSWNDNHQPPYQILELRYDQKHVMVDAAASLC